MPEERRENERKKQGKRKRKIVSNNPPTYSCLLAKNMYYTELSSYLLTLKESTKKTNREEMYFIYGVGYSYNLGLLYAYTDPSTYVHTGTYIHMCIHSSRVASMPAHLHVLLFHAAQWF